MAPTTIQTPPTVGSDVKAGASGIVYTSVQMSVQVFLYVCIATKEAVESDGLSNDDFMTMPSRFELVSVPDFEPKRTVFASSQPMSITRTSPSDQLLWTQYTCNTTSSTYNNATQTPIYTVTTVPQSLALPSILLPGVWTFCVNVRAAGIWTESLAGKLLIIPKPLYTPSAALAGVSTPINFLSQLAGDYPKNDLVVFQQSTCDNAHTAVLSAYSQPKVAIQEVVVNSETVYRISTNAGANGQGLVVICYATAESLGNEAGDFTKLDKKFSQLGFDPPRMIQGAPQLIKVIGGNVGDRLGFTKEASCWSFNNGHPGYAGQTLTAIYTYASATGEEEFPFPIDVEIGQWGLCFQPLGAVELVPIGWQAGGYKLTVVQKPTFFPGVGMAASYNIVTFSSSLGLGDLVVLQPGTDCTGAELVTNGTDTTRMSKIAMSSTRQIITPLTFTKSGSFAVCVASKESKGDQSSDFSIMDAQFALRERIVFHPMRTVQGASQLLSATGGVTNDLVVWTTSTASDACEAPLGDATPYKTWAYMLSGLPEQQLQFIANGVPGIWTMCFLPSNGVWTQISERDLVVIPLPSFWPQIGVAGSFTPLKFTRGPGQPNTTRGDVIDGDILVLQEANCLNAHTQTMGEASSSPNPITNYYGYTHPNMTKDSTVLQGCFATKESFGNSQDDYVQLLQTVRQVRRALYTTTRVVYGVSQRMHVFQILFPNYKYKWVQAVNCSVTQPNSQLTTPTYDAVVGANNWNILETNYKPGAWKFCFLPEGGIFTEMWGQGLDLLARPTYLPHRALVGLSVNMTIFGMHTGVKPYGYSYGVVKPGDYLVIQPGNCNNAHLAVNTHSSLGDKLGNYDQYLRLNYRNQIETTDFLTERAGNEEGGIGGTELKICFATQEAVESCPGQNILQCHDKDDWAELDQPFQLLEWPDFTVGHLGGSPTQTQLLEKRTVTGAKQRINMFGGFNGDTFTLTQRYNCWYLEDPYGSPSVEAAVVGSVNLTLPLGYSLGGQSTSNYVWHGRMDVPSDIIGEDGLSGYSPRPWVDAADGIQTHIYNVTGSSTVVVLHDYAEPGEFRYHSSTTPFVSLLVELGL